MGADYLEAIFRPRSIALIGASKTPGKLGYEILTNIVKYGFSGPIFPINPKYNEIHDIRCYKSILDVVDEVDLAILTGPIDKIPKLIGELGAKGVKVAVVISGMRGDPSSKEICKAIKRHGIRLVGPSSLGVMYAKGELNATLGPVEVLDGNVALITESSTLGVALMGLASIEEVGLSAVIGLGDKLDIDETDVLQFFEEDMSTKAILIYMESVKNKEKFLRVAKRISKSKPIVLIGPRHGVIEELSLEEAGILPARDIQQALDWAKALSTGVKAGGKRVLIVTNSGGAGKMAYGLAKGTEIDLVKPSEELKEELSQFVPEKGRYENPVDLTGRAEIDAYRGVLEVALSSDEVDGVIAIYCESVLSDPSRIVDIIYGLKGTYNKPTLVSVIGGARALEALRKLREKGIPAYPTPHRAINSMEALIKWSLFSK